MLSSQPSTRDLTDDQIASLQKKGFTKGLATSLGENLDFFPKRFWIVDNSYSMSTKDGHKLDMKSTNVLRDIECSRWDEIRDCVHYHEQMSNLLGAPTEFRLLNQPSETERHTFFAGVEGSQSHLDRTLQYMKPTGKTPLTSHVLNLQKEIKEMANDLNAKGQKVVIVLATDGLPLDNDSSSFEEARIKFVDAMRSLEGLPVWIVIRLCTDEDHIVSFYNDLDDNLELSLEVLDDYDAEAKEIYEHNKWLNYTLALHRTRELGFHDRVFDLIDERALTKGELRTFFSLLFGEGAFDGVPDPSIDWVGFESAVGQLVGLEKDQWNPIHRSVRPLVDMREMNKKYGPSNESCGCAIM